MVQTSKIRRQFLDYFKKHHHAIIPSSSVVPHEDPTLLFTNAGMNQFKDVFLGHSHRDYKRAATSQKSIRVGGKHNDLENVGHTSRHLTFFEMLGNFSFGDYFKKEAIQFAWEVSTEIFGFDKKRIWPSVFRDDKESFELWTHYVPTERIGLFGEKDNFWEMGETGPCGPCSELYFDRGPQYGKATSPLEDTEGTRFLEFWNLVFMQYNRQPSRQLDPLPRPSIDTGAGLERVLSLMMGVETVFETDVLKGLIQQVEHISKKRYNPADQMQSAPFRVIADHLRCLAFAIADGAQPSNVDRGYVLRKVLRRAVRYGRQLGMEDPFLGKVLPTLVALMGDDYPELKNSQERITEILTLEEESFLRTLKRGGNILNQIMERSQMHGHAISGDDAFKLKDTYGLPLEEIALIAKDAGLTIHEERYHQLEKEAKERSRSAQKTAQQIAKTNVFEHFLSEQGPTAFVGYADLTSSSNILALVVEGQFVSHLEAGSEGSVILDKTPFYAEMGGQVGDTGILKNSQVTFEVTNCVSPFKGVIAHMGKVLQGSLKVGDSLTAAIDAVRRQKIANHHTATHLLHWALHHVLGPHVKQAGSVVEADRLRFDFSHHKALTPEEIRKLEHLVNEKIRENTPVNGYEISYEEAQKRQEIKQFFGEKYGSLVRVIDIDFSKELCGGTHTSALGNIGYFRITKESSIAAGIRRIEAVTGEAAEAFSYETEDEMASLQSLLKAQPGKMKERVEKLLEEHKQMAQDLKSAKKKELQAFIHSWVKEQESFHGIPLIMKKTALSNEEIREGAEDLLSSLSSGIVVLASIASDKCHVLVRITDNLVQKGFHAQELVKTIAPLIEGSGGGKSNQAQAGGKAPHKIDEAFAKVRDWIQKHS